MPMSPVQSVFALLEPKPLHQKLIPCGAKAVALCVNSGAGARFFAPSLSLTFYPDTLFVNRTFGTVVDSRRSGTEKMLVR